jgi:TRAP-type C4-dicarboxylate transport system substrate-binding protein
MLLTDGNKEATMHSMRRIGVIRCLSALTLMATAAACSAAGATDKAGSATVVLKLASIDEVNGNGQAFGPQAFVDGLSKLSGGRLKIEVAKEFGNGGAEAESDLVKAIASGKLDGGWPATRAFSGAGISGLEAVEAPLTITSYAAEKALVTGPPATTVLTRLKGTGVVGLGLAVGPLRRPFAADKPLLGPADWQGTAFRVYNSPIQTETIKALGATPVNLGFSWVDEVRTKKLQGIEFDIAQYVQNGDTTEVGNVTANVVLWPKVYVLSFSQRRFDALSEQQRGWIRQAADQAVNASVHATYDETTPARALCSVGVRFAWASSAQMTAMRTRVQPVLDRLAADPSSGPLLKEIEAIATKYPQPVVPDVPADCRRGTSAPAPASTVPTQKSPLPDGIYRQHVTVPDVEAAGLSNNDGWSGTWTMTVRHATYEVRCRPIADPGKDCGNFVADAPVEVGDLRGTGSELYFVPNAARISQLTGCKLPPSNTLADHCGPDDPYRVNWKLTGNQLTLSGYAAEGSGLGLKPWTKIS